MYKIKTINLDLVNAYKRLFGFDDIYAKLLVAKEFVGESFLTLLHPKEAIINPTLLTHGKDAVKAIQAFLEQHQDSILWVFADFDADGITSAYIMHYALTSYIASKGINCTVKVHLPERSEGYGINRTWVDQLETPLPTMVITVDNGTNAVEAIEALNARHIPVVVTDHHKPEQKTANCLIVNPSCYNEDPHKHLAGCGVAYKLGMLLIGQEAMYHVVDALCVGTIGDMMEMTDENIAFCQLGLERLNSNEGHKGLLLLKESNTLTYKDIAFEIVPKLNCCGRMGKIDFAKQVIFNPNEDLVEAIVALNDERKALTKHYVKLAKEQNSYVVVLEECIAGIAGIIAGQLSQTLQANVIVLVSLGDKLTGSARAYQGNVLEQIQSLTSTYDTLFASGHNEACGVSIDRSQITAFIKDFNAIQKTTIYNSVAEPTYVIDMELSLKEVNTRTLASIRRLPYDKKNLKEPLFLITADLDKKERTKTNPDNVWLTLKDPNEKRCLKLWAKDMSAKAFSLKFKKGLKFIATLEKDFRNPIYATLNIIDILE